jgi:hypothetical protein
MEHQSNEPQAPVLSKHWQDMADSLRRLASLVKEAAGELANISKQVCSFDKRGLVPLDKPLSQLKLEDELKKLMTPFIEGLNQAEDIHHSEKRLSAKLLGSIAFTHSSQSASVPLEDGPLPAGN